MQTGTALRVEGVAERTTSAAPVKRPGFFWNWGPQAWIDMFMTNRMIVRQAGPLVPYTFLPILRMTTDRERIDREWAEMRSRRETVRLLDSPRERWRKHYGNFVREVEWALLELRKHFTPAQYEDIVVGTGWFGQPASLAADPMWTFHPVTFGGGRGGAGGCTGRPSLSTWSGPSSAASSSAVSGTAVSSTVTCSGQSSVSKSWERSN